MTDKDKPENMLVPVFNALSFGDRMTLYTAVTAAAITRIAREDTGRNRLFYPVYFLPIAFILAPIPIPGANLIPLAGMAACMGGWTALGLTPSARQNRAEIARDFRHATIIENYRAMVVPGATGHNVKNLAVATHVAKAMWRDTAAATRHFFGLRRG